MSKKQIIQEVMSASMSFGPRKGVTSTSSAALTETFQDITEVTSARPAAAQLEVTAPDIVQVYPAAKAQTNKSARQGGFGQNVSHEPQVNIFAGGKKEAFQMPTFDDATEVSVGNRVQMDTTQADITQMEITQRTGTIQADITQQTDITRTGTTRIVPEAMDTTRIVPEAMDTTQIIPRKMDMKAGENIPGSAALNLGAMAFGGAAGMVSEGEMSVSGFARGAMFGLGGAVAGRAAMGSLHGGTLGRGVQGIGTQLASNAGDGMIGGGARTAGEFLESSVAGLDMGRSAIATKQKVAAFSGAGLASFSMGRDRDHSRGINRTRGTRF